MGRWRVDGIKVHRINMHCINVHTGGGLLAGNDLSTPFPTPIPTLRFFWLPRKREGGGGGRVIVGECQEGGYSLGFWQEMEGIEKKEGLNMMVRVDMMERYCLWIPGKHKTMMPSTAVVKAVAAVMAVTAVLAVTAVMAVTAVLAVTTPVSGSLTRLLGLAPPRDSCVWVK